MSLPAPAAGLIVLLAAVLYFFRDSGSADAHTAALAVPVEDSADSLTSLDSDQLARRILAQQQLVVMNQTLLARLEAPEPIYLTERSALPANRLEIAAYHSEFREYSAALMAAKTRLEALHKANEELFTESPLAGQHNNEVIEYE